MQIAYIISAYQLADLLIRLIQRLHSPNVTFWLHVDKKTPSHIFNQMQQGMQALPNVYFLKRHTCHWGGLGHVQATLEGIHELVTRNIPFDHVTLLTGQDYPLKTNQEIEKFFVANANHSFMEYRSLPDPQWDVMCRLEYSYYRVWGKWVNLPLMLRSAKHRQMKRLANRFLPSKRVLPAGFKAYGGSSYWSLSRAAIEYIADYLNHHPEYLSFFKRVFVPDEFFFQMLLMNSDLQDQVMNTNLRFIDWTNQSGRLPSILCEEDLDVLLASPALFARKFDPRVDSRILNLLDERLTQGR